MTSPLDLVGEGAPSMQRTQDSGSCALIFVCSPADSRLCLNRAHKENELNGLCSELRSAGWEVKVQHGGDASKLREFLTQLRPRVLHFIGHANVKDRNADPTLGLTNEDGDLVCMLPETIVDVVSSCDTLHLVFLNGCNSEEMARALAARDVPTVGWRTATVHMAAAAMSPPFYASLLGGIARGSFANALKTAYAQGVLAIKALSTSGPASPVDRFAIADPAEYADKRLLDGRLAAGVPILARRSAWEVPVRGPQPLLPAEVNNGHPSFTGRQQYLEQLRDRFFPVECIVNDAQQDARARRVQAITGDDDIGKTELAKQYALREAHRYPGGVFFVAADANSEITTPLLQRLARMIGNSTAAADSDELRRQVHELRMIGNSTAAADSDELRRQVHELLCARVGWLLIVDNVDNTDACRPGSWLSRSLPPANALGDVLITSSTGAEALTALGVPAPLQLGGLSSAEAEVFLIRTKERAALSVTEAEQRIAALDVTEGEALAWLAGPDGLKGHPRKLMEAACYMREKQVTFSAYQDRVVALRRLDQASDISTFALADPDNGNVVTGRLAACGPEPLHPSRHPSASPDKAMVARSRTTELSPTNEYEDSGLVRDDNFPPKLQLGADKSIAWIVNSIKLGEAPAELAREKHLLVVMGNTGAGKSTMINYLHGCKMEVVRRCQIGLNGTDKVYRVAPDSLEPELMQIGHESMSKTFIPEIASASTSLGEGFAFVDCPGFLDSRGFEYNIANAVNIKQSIATAQSVRVLVLINYHTLKADRARGVRDLCQILADLFAEDFVASTREAVLVGVSQTPPRDEDLEPHKLEHVRNLLLDTSGLPKAAGDTVRVLSDSLFAYDVLDRGHASWITRPNILERIRRLKPITDSTAIFRTVLVPEAERELRRVVEELNRRIELALQVGEYALAAETLNLVGMIECVDNVIVTRLLSESVNSVRVAVHTLERNAMAATMLDDFASAAKLLYQLDSAARALGEAKGLGVDLPDLVQRAQAFQDRRRKDREELKELRDVLKEAASNQAKLEGQVHTLLIREEEMDNDLQKLKRDKESLEQRHTKNMEARRTGLKAEQERLQAELARAAPQGEDAKGLDEQLKAIQAEADRAFQRAEALATEERNAHERLILAQQKEAEKTRQQREEAQRKLEEQQRTLDAQERQRAEVEAMAAAAVARARQEQERRERANLARPSSVAVEGFLQKVGCSEVNALRAARELHWNGKRITDTDCKVLAWLVSDGFLHRLTNLSLGENQIGDEGMWAFACALSNGSLRQLTLLYLSGNQIGDVGMSAFFAALSTGAMGSLEKLFLWGNQIGDEGMKSFAAALSKGLLHHLKVLRLDKNKIADGGMKAFAGAVSSRSLHALKELYLGDNQIGDDGMTAFAGALSNGALESLTRLDLGNIQVGVPGIRGFACELANGSLIRLETLRLGGCRMDDEAREDMRRTCSARSIDLKL